MSKDSYALELVTGPAAEPVSLLEAKAHLRVDVADDDILLVGLIKAARQWAETFTRRGFVTQEWKLLLDEFPTAQSGEAGESGLIRLPLPPAQSITSVQYVDSNGATQTVAAADYTLDKAGEPARLVPAFGKSWPSARAVPNAVTVTFKAGYGTPGISPDDSVSKVPEAIKTALKILIGHWYEHREAVSEEQPLMPVPMALESLLWPYRVLRF